MDKKLSGEAEDRLPTALSRSLSTLGDASLHHLTRSSSSKTYPSPSKERYSDLSIHPKSDLEVRIYDTHLALCRFLLKQSSMVLGPPLTRTLQQGRLLCILERYRPSSIEREGRAE